MSQRIERIQHLDHMPKATKALSILKRLAERVEPIMDKHDLKITTLKEFYPKNPRHLGQNRGPGLSVRIRLRESGDESKFRPEWGIINTMLHELTHNRYPDHDDDFKSYLQELRDEYDSRYGPVTWPAYS
jgi:hypothetical protein